MRWITENLWWRQSDLLVTDPPYNVQSVREDWHSNHYKLSVDDKKVVMSFWGEMMKTGFHGHMFCTSLNFASWYKLLVNEVEEKDDRSMLRSDLKRASSDKEAVFNLRPVALH